jgi:hypothetical protein
MSCGIDGQGCSMNGQCCSSYACVSPGGFTFCQPGEAGCTCILQGT